jgi:asparagine N-glycosylation enzyme membrane subunit Stt3
MTLIAMDNLAFLILLSLPFIGMVIYNLIKKRDTNMNVSLFILIWFLATLYASRLGIRFTLILVPALSLGLGFCLGRLHKLLSSYMEKGLNVPVSISSVLVPAVFLLLLISPVAAGWKTAASEIPSMDDAWYEALTFIKENSTDDDYKDARWDGAIINSWWDFGHWFKSIGDRAVTFDGASQNTPMAHWIGKVLLTDDENQAIGILKMLDCGSNNAFDNLDMVLNNSPKSIDIIYEIIVQDKNTAINTLLGFGLTEKQAADVIANTHCEPPENYFITSEDMVGKSGVWAHFGSWDFYKSEMYMRVKNTRKENGINILTTDYGLSEQEASKTYYDIQIEEANDWIAPWPSYAQNIRCLPGNNTLNCGGIVIDFDNKVVDYPKQDQIKLKEVLYLSDSGLKSINVDEKGSFSLSVLPGERTALFMSSELTHSMFNILFYYSGEGLEHFDLVKHTTTLTGQDIYVWKVDWNGK